MIINYCTFADETLGSFRYSMLTPARELQSRGHSIYVTRMPHKDADVGIFCKHLNYADIDYMQWFKEKGKKTVYHVSDYHFDTKHREHYIGMIKEADIVTCTTEPLKEVIKHETGVDAVVIHDPYFYREGPVKFEPEGRLKVLWFGHQSNAGTLEPLLAWLDTFCDLTILSNRVTSKILKRDIYQWSIEAAPQFIDRCDLVIIPTANDNTRLVKSNNRMLESIRRGRFAISDQLPCYDEFRGMMWVDGVKEGFKWLKEQPHSEIMSRIKKAQEYIRDKYSPKMVADKWEQVLGIR